ncbi:high affinity cAMP-specific and IBMX-insensitive 3',5'-cyclic phosphodiesterase 8B-like isoform X2 [Mercenaria mercenaria]|uniref:high affinity cAMP-specific and IBMX-insensitive 3',5'-cyclic phosphodiesterase 8B-like isoform X2 n=1 Tax=Mercenaria mercenaria TaxID=6596 RepID=UPI00234EC341|nr:high affinity cAMP-specific and IBMX-insensitive 3',5'-cyclic phosphodiesterase 8B-like isoform X2 [Mercenaria mercenaria]
MGCTPSIHVNQTGVVYCRDSDGSNSPRASHSATVIAGTTVVRTETTETSHTSSIRSKRFTEYSSGPSGGASYTFESSSDNTKKASNSDVMLGPMKLKQKSMSILLVFSREDYQSDAFYWAAEKAGYKCNISRNPDSALECFMSKQHDVVIIDHRNNKSFDAEALCRSIRGTKASEHTIIVAVTKKHSQTDKDEPSILPLLKAGFNRRYVENSNVGACMNELVQLEHGEVLSHQKLRTCNALFSALESVTDSVEITNDEHEIQFVNPAYERLTGYSMEEVVGKDSRELKGERVKPDIQDGINNQIKKGKKWEGTYYTRRKSGDAFPQHCKICPVVGVGGKATHYVSVRSSHLDTSNFYDKLKDADYFTQIANGGIHGVPRRRESFARIHSMTIEAPITKQDVKRHLREGDQAHAMTHRPSVHQAQSHLPNQPSMFSSKLIPDNIRALLVKEADWDFDIIELERVTHKRPLLYLGLRTMARFDVCGFLNIPETCLANWLQVIEANYHSRNTYHNSTHAADVLNSTAYFLEKGKCKAIFDPIDEVAALIAAAVHDLDHPGKSNAFLINSKHELSILYNDIAVLESHHAALTFRLTAQDPAINIFKNLDRETFRVMRQAIIDMVLATEMMKHFEHLNKFVNGINKLTQKAEESSSMSGTGSPDSATLISQLSTSENKMLIRRMLIKCADVSNPCRPVNLCMEWAKRIAEEYCQQTDEEKQLGLPVVMPVFDRKTCSLPKSQTSFIDFFINDMFDAWDYFCDIPELIQHLQDNYKFWTEEEENPTHNYDLPIKGPEQNIDNATKSTENKSSSTENTENRTCEDT